MRTLQEAVGGGLAIALLIQSFDSTPREVLKVQLGGEVAFGVVVADEASDGGHPE